MTPPIVKLTPGQRTELRQLAGGPQPTFGYGRVHIQIDARNHNNLVKKGLARYIDTVGQFVAIDSPEIDRCEITEAGRAALKENTR